MPFSQLLSDQPRRTSSIHQILGRPSAVTLIRTESRSVNKPSRTTGVRTQSRLLSDGQAATDISWVTTDRVWLAARSYLKPVKVKSQAAPELSQPREAP